uniref:Uncharacterized protein n=1 Tax=Pararge aegeria TaxID=116150 RepID=S4PNC7_9NEOP
MVYRPTIFICVKPKRWKISNHLRALQGGTATRPKLRVSTSIGACDLTALVNNDYIIAGLAKLTFYKTN